MSKIAMIASLALVAPVDSPINLSGPWRPRTAEVAVETFPSTPVNLTKTSPVVWKPAPEDESLFDLIPTETRAQTELIPTVWQARTVVANQPPATQR